MWKKLNSHLRIDRRIKNCLTICDSLAEYKKEKGRVKETIFWFGCSTHYLDFNRPRLTIGCFWSNHDYSCSAAYERVIRTNQRVKDWTQACRTIHVLILGQRALPGAVKRRLVNEFQWKKRMRYNLKREKSE